MMRRDRGDNLKDRHTKKVARSVTIVASPVADGRGQTLFNRLDGRSVNLTGLTGAEGWERSKIYRRLSMEDEIRRQIGVCAVNHARWRSESCRHQRNL
jgi:hypothetical protein